MKIKDYSDIDTLEAYLLGQLDSKDMYEVEKLSLEDPFVSQALEGLRKSKHLRHNLSFLQKQLQEKVNQKQNIKKSWQITAQRLSIGSAAAVLFISVGILFWLRSSPPKQVTESSSTIAGTTAATTAAGSLATSNSTEPLIASASTGSGTPSSGTPSSATPSSATTRSVATGSATTNSASSQVGILANSILALEGTIKDSQTNQVITGAKIEVIGSKVNTLSSSKGEFNLVMEEVKYPLNIKVTAAGYQDFQIQLNEISNKQNWRLIPR